MRVVIKHVCSCVAVAHERAAHPATTGRGQPTLFRQCTLVHAVVVPNTIRQLVRQCRQCAHPSPDIRVQITTQMPVINRLIEQLQVFAQRSDYDVRTPGNGYRYACYPMMCGCVCSSLICITDTCILHLVRLLRLVQQQRASLVFRTQHYCKELETYTQMLMFLVQR